MEEYNQKYEMRKKQSLKILQDCIEDASVRQKEVDKIQSLQFAQLNSSSMVQPSPTLHPRNSSKNLLQS